VNAFSIAGGRVYVSPKIVAFARSGDEIAGILAHELGHIVTHQSAIEMTRSFREVLGVTQVSDRADVFRKFHDYVENVSRLRTRRKRAEEEKHQIAADQVSIFAMARAGFNVQAFPEFWGRFTEFVKATAFAGRQSG
jgi:predicted Zn-dependent protease